MDSLREMNLGFLCMEHLVIKTVNLLYRMKTQNNIFNSNLEKTRLYSYPVFLKICLFNYIFQLYCIVQKIFFLDDRKKNIIKTCK